MRSDAVLIPTELALQHPDLHSGLMCSWFSLDMDEFPLVEEPRKQLLQPEENEDSR